MSSFWAVVKAFLASDWRLEKKDEELMKMERDFKKSYSRPYGKNPKRAKLKSFGISGAVGKQLVG